MYQAQTHILYSQYILALIEGELYTTDPGSTLPHNFCRAPLVFLTKSLEWSVKQDYDKPFCSERF